MFKASTKILLAILALTLMCSCSLQPSNSSNTNGNADSDISIQGFSTPEAVFNSLIADRREGKLTAERLWDVYLSDTSKDLGIFTKDEFIKESNANRSLDTIKGYTIDKVNVLSDQKYAVLSYKITTTSIYGEEKVTTYEDPLVLENGQWKLLLLGIYNIFDYPREVDENGVSISSVSIRQALSGILVSYSISNRTEKTYSLGLDGAPEMQLETDKNIFTMPLKDSLKLSAGADYTSSIFFSGATGNIKSLKLTDVYELDAEGSPTNPNRGKSITRSLNYSIS